MLKNVIYFVHGVHVHMKLLMFFFVLSATTHVAAVNVVDFGAKGDGVTDDD